MNEVYEAWSIGQNEFICYTENSDAHNALNRFNPICGTYEKRGHVFAWQHRVNRSALKYLDSKFSGNGTLKNKDLQASDIRDLPHVGRSRSKPRFDLAPTSYISQPGSHEMTEDVK